jgi:hypothetical protein
MSSADRSFARGDVRSDRFVVFGIAVVAIIQLVTAAWIVVAPHSFYTQVGAFGLYNGHFLRDAGTMTLGAGLALAASLRWTSLRAGALAANLGLIGVHAVNHWFDVGNAHAGSNAGVSDAVSLTILAAFTAVVMRVAMREDVS